uniref:Cadherin domain-containing protein n=2 Tax=Tetranychus urticae TaxID=32264 RepID=T1KXU3_TETUR
MDRGLVVGSIEAFDLDLAPHTLTYAMVSDGSFGGPEPEEYIFNLNEKTGKFTLMRHLDYESDPNHFIITCEAFDGLYRSEQINVYFNLINLNDNWPIFDPATYKVELLENVTLGHQVVCLSATDADAYDAINEVYTFNGSSSSSSAVNYYFKDTETLGLTSTNEISKFVSGPFKIDGTSGCIELVDPLDREMVTHYDLVVIADDGYHRTSASVAIKVKDVNDNDPVFDRRTPTILRIPENLGPDSLVYGFKADDADGVPNNYVRYDLENGNPSGNGDFPFAIGPINGLLRLTGRLDRETTDTYSLIVRARDYGGRSRSITVTLHVSDVNDNSPSFEQSEIQVSIPENASLQSTVVRLRAYDQDSPDKISYRIASGDVFGHFGIFEDTVIVTMALDYETIPIYDLQIQAIDEAGNSDTARLVINLVNVHDQPPTFVASPYSVNWCENEVGPIGYYQAIGETIDKSSGQPELNYLLKNNHEGYFELNSTSALLSAIKPIDRESLGKTNSSGFIELRIIAIDKRLPRLTGEGIVLVNIIDVNDNRPKFSSPSYSFELVENSIHMAGKPFGSVKASDFDLTDTLSYQIVEDDSDHLFSVDSHSGQLFLQSDTSFDREQRSAYHLTIEVSDSKWTDTTKTTISIGDVNDCKPVFRSLNGHPIDSQIGRVTLKMASQRLALLSNDLFLFGLVVTDCDLIGSANARVQFNLETLNGPSTDGLFTIDERTGVIRSTRSLEANSSYSIKIIAEDMALRNRLDNNLIVDLMVNNDGDSRKPKRLIELVHKISVSENVKPGKIVHSFGLLPDIPSTSSDSVSLIIIGGDPSGNFRIDRKYLRIGKPLDYEEATSYELYIEASLDDYYEISVVKVEVINENDNPPKFDHELYNATIVEEIDEPVLVTSLGATDRDLVDEEDNESDGKLRYFIESPKDTPFRIDEKYGTLWTTRKIDRETTASFELTMGVRDEDGLTGRTRVLITVLDKNDNPPRFTRLFSVNITENAPIGSVVIQVTSSDRDEGSYAQAIYSLLGHSEAFDIRPTTGEVFVTGPLDREIQDEYLLMVSANDGSWKAQTTLTINIIDENDNAPVFEKSIYEFNYVISEDDSKSVSPSVGLVGQVHARDLDKGFNSLISYSLKHNSDYFTIDSTTGVIRIKQVTVGNKMTSNVGKNKRHNRDAKLTYNSQLAFLNQFNLTVIASDRGTIPQSSETNVLISLKPTKSSESTGSMRTPSLVHKISLPYDLLNGSLLYSLGDDYILKDSGSNKIVSLTTSGNVIFIGQGMVKKREEWTYKFESLSNHGLVTLIITICSPNRSSPRFTSGQSQLVVPENESTNDVLTQFKAMDDDEDTANSQLTYSFEIIEWTFNERAGDYYRRVIKPQLEPSESLLISLSLKTLLNQTVSTKSILKPFTLDSSTGIVYLNAPLDYELITCYRLRVTATDSAYFAPRNTSIMVNIHVTDVNDNPPMFVGLKDGRLVLETLENNPIGSTIGIITATDYDSLRYSQLTYEILPEQDSGYFTLGSKNGHLSSLVSFDHESKRSYSIKVIARNDRKVFTTVPVEIRIGNVNEYLPKFKSSRFTFDITKSMTAGSVIGSLADKATDEDYNETIYFYLIKHGRFGIELDRNGTLRLTETIDFNDVHSDKGLSFTVIAKNAGPIRDRSDYDEAKIVINIIGANRLSHFNQSNYICNGDKSICSDDSTSPDALSVGTILFVIFFAIILLILLASFVIFRQQRKRPMPSCIGGTIGQRKLGLRQIPINKSHHTLNGAHSQSSSFLHSSHHNQPTAPPAPPPPPPPLTKQRPPDVIESPVSVPPAPPIPQRAPPMPPPSFMTPFSDINEDYSDVMLTGGQYDLENASSIAPSDIDLAYRYKPFRSAVLNGRDSRNGTSGQHHRHAPLARLSPSVSELTAPRILTLNDLTSTNGPPSVIPSCPPRPPGPPKSKLGLPLVTSNRHPYNQMVGQNQNHLRMDEEEDDAVTDDSFSSSEFDGGSSNYERAENNKNIMLRRVL